MWPGDAGAVLLPLAREAIAVTLDVPVESSPEPVDAWLDEPGASFVTLHLAGRLRGCIGTLQAYRSIRDDVRGNARAAAFEDPRFGPLTREEYAGIDLEVSLLSPPEEMPWSSEAELLREVRPGVDGLLLQAGSHRGTFLPQVWDQLPDPQVFFQNLKSKAGLGRKSWGRDWRVFRYTVTAWAEP
ncbi:AmmeMemoRadiSam system protein A [Ammonicoccus fulvus]|uniref:AmmeMemoRadiSam system protein A n=1 Tax=Ammonicoccus fulvus TaxID=3138240 RepID=A0ABZ3FSF3_9ACTN